MSQTFSKADIHNHSTVSDGFNTPEELVEKAALHTDLRVLAVTDHDSVEGGQRACEYWQQHRDRFPHLEIVRGIEVSSAQGHILGLYVERNIAPGQSIEDTVAAIHAQGGIAIAAHPFTPMRLIYPDQGMGQRVGEDFGFDAVEVLNSATTEIFANPYAAHFNQRHQKLPQVGGSDSHHWRMMAQSYTLFPGHTAEDLRQALLQGTVKAGGHVVNPLIVLPAIWKLFLGHTFKRNEHKGATRKRDDYSIHGD